MALVQQAGRQIHHLDKRYGPDFRQRHGPLYLRQQFGQRLNGLRRGAAVFVRHVGPG